MFDSISPAAIPRNAKMVAGYIDGLYAWEQSDWDMFPNAVKVEITALGLDHGVVLNLEPNGYWPSDLGVGWVRRRRARGVDPAIYCNYVNHLHLVQAAFDRAGEPYPHFWVAKYDGVAVIPPGCIAKQYAAPEGSGTAKAPAHYDISVVAEHWPGVDSGARPAGGAGSPDTEELDMIIELPPSPTTTGKVLALDPNRNWRIVVAASNQAVWSGHFYNWAPSNDNESNGTGGDPQGTAAAPQDGGRIDINEPWVYDVPPNTAKCAFEYSSNGVVSIGVYTR